MNRIYLPLFFAICAGVVWYFNGHHTEMKLVFPLVPLVPGYASSPSAQGDLTWQLFAGLSGLSAVVNLIRWLSDPKRPVPPSA